ncbi:MAG TPA: ketoacyl-ACP synthase III [Rectinemataceae bacterium]|nr:ketoacyl-ACP synthase III [Rectinemataceae bacterium]
MEVRAVITGTGSYAPGIAIDNAELMKLAGVEFDGPRLEEKIGIGKRHIARLRGIDETTVDFAEKASIRAMEAAGIAPADIGLFIVATDTPEYVSPASGILLQGRLQKGEREAEAIDISSSCASFVAALDLAARKLTTDYSIRHALVAGVYNMPAHIRDGDAFGWSIFADGAGAVVLSREEGPGASRYVDGVFRVDGTQWDFVGVYAGGTRKPLTRELLDSGRYGLELLQKLPGDRNVKLWPPLVLRLLEKAGWKQDRVAHFIFTQINLSVIREVMEILGEPMTKTTTVMDHFGYTGSGCLPMALDEALRSGRVKKGDAVVLVASGAGLSVGANLIVL